MGRDFPTLEHLQKAERHNACVARRRTHPTKQIKLLGVAGGGSEKEVAAFLGQALEPPERKAVAAAVQALVNIGALQPGSLAMTPLGAHLAELPVVGAGHGGGCGAGVDVTHLAELPVVRGVLGKVVSPQGPRDGKE